MNVERWIKTRRSAWSKLENLLELIDLQGISHLDAHQVHDLGQLYKAVSADLSRARAWNVGRDTHSYLNMLVVKAHNQVYQKQSNRVSDLWKFLWYGFPDLLQKNILYVAVSALLFVTPLIGSYFLAQYNVNFAHLELINGNPLVPEDIWTILQQHRLWTDSVAKISPLSFSLITVNNIRVAILAFVMGITFGIGTVYVLFVNGLMIGTIFGASKLFNMSDRLFAFVAPHSVLELSAVIISGAAGLVIGKALLFPGRWKRLDALKMAANTAVGLFGGCIPLLLVAGAIEGFISSRTDLSNIAKYAVSLATAIFLGFYLFAPRRILQIDKTTEKLPASSQP